MTTSPLPIRFTRDPAEAGVALTRRRGFEEPTLSPGAKAGIRRVFGADLTAEQVVDRILADVRTEGDAAVRRYTEAFDGMAPASFEVPKAEWGAALAGIEPDLVEALRVSADQIADFHRKQLRTSWIEWSDEGGLGQLIRPLERIGVYAPGGSAVYPSSLLMTA